MRQYLRMTGYAFLAMSGLYAWLSIEAGWRHYAGLLLFFAASVRIMALLKRRGPGATDNHVQKRGGERHAAAPDPESRD